MATPVIPGGLTPENHRRLLQTVFFMPNTDITFIQNVLEKLPSRWSDYPEFLAWAILANKKDVVAFLLNDGAMLDNPPMELSHQTYGLSAETTEVLRAYRRTPYIVLAATQGNAEVVELLLQKGATVSQVGFVGTSKARLNAVITNVLGAAVFHSRAALVQWLCSKFSAAELGLEFPTLEERTVGKSLAKEYSTCTPLLLSIHRCESPEVTNTLLAAGANMWVLDWQQNNAMHLAASMRRVEVVRALLSADPAFKEKRNGKGETPASIAKDKGFQDVLALFAETDQSAREAKELLELLGKEEAKKKPRKPKKKKQEAAPPMPVPPAEAVNPPAEAANPPAETANPPAETANPPAEAAKPPAEAVNPPTEADLSAVLSPLFSALSTHQPFTHIPTSSLSGLLPQLRSALSSVESALNAS